MDRDPHRTHVLDEWPDGANECGGLVDPSEKTGAQIAGYRVTATQAGALGLGFRCCMRAR